MAIHNNIAKVNQPINTGNLSQVKKNEKTEKPSQVNDVAPVTTKSNTNEFSLVLSKQQEAALNDTLGYDQPSAKGLGAIDIYQQVANQKKRDDIIDKMSFHFVV